MVLNLFVVLLNDLKYLFTIDGRGLYVLFFNQLLNKTNSHSLPVGE